MTSKEIKEERVRIIATLCDSRQDIQENSKEFDKHILRLYELSNIPNVGLSRGLATAVSMNTLGSEEVNRIVSDILEYPTDARVEAVCDIVNNFQRNLVYAITGDMQCHMSLQSVLSSIAGYTKVVREVPYV